jgi:hypothetical protein
VSSEAADPSLSSGYAFFGQIKRYYEHLEEHSDLPVEVSVHDALISQSVDRGNSGQPV